MFIYVSRLVGCQDLLEDTPNRLSQRSASCYGSPNESKTLIKGNKSFHGKASSKYSFREDLSSKFVLWSVAVLVIEKSSLKIDFCEM